MTQNPYLRHSDKYYNSFILCVRFNDSLSIWRLSEQVWYFPVFLCEHIFDRGQNAAWSKVPFLWRTRRVGAWQKLERRRSATTATFFHCVTCTHRIDIFSIFRDFNGFSVFDLHFRVFSWWPCYARMACSTSTEDMIFSDGSTCFFCAAFSFVARSKE